MFYGTLTPASTVNAASSYIFNPVMLTNNNIRYNTTTGLFTFLKAGLYKVSFSTSGSSAAGTVAPTLVLSGNLSTTALCKFTPTAITDFRSGSFETIIRVDNGPSGIFATMNVLNDGTVAQNVTSGDIIIERVA